MARTRFLIIGKEVYRYAKIGGQNDPYQIYIYFLALLTTYTRSSQVHVRHLQYRPYMGS